MDGVLQKDPFFHKQEVSFRRNSIKLKRYKEDSTKNSADGPLSGDEEATEVNMSSPIKLSKKGAKKRVISVPIKDCDGSRSNYKGEIYPPFDSCTWRKYGQKPIKGSIYPRGYYRCSSSKGCPAKKQVERCQNDPNVLLITYSSDHNHPLPAAATNHRHPTTTFAATNRSIVRLHLPTRKRLLGERCRRVRLFLLCGPHIVGEYFVDGGVHLG